MSDQQLPEAIGSALSEADGRFRELDDALAALSDGDLHRAHRDGVWTVAQVVSHISMCTILSLGDLKHVEKNDGVVPSRVESTAPRAESTTLGADGTTVSDWVARIQDDNWLADRRPRVLHASTDQDNFQQRPPTESRQVPLNAVTKGSNAHDS